MVFSGCLLNCLTKRFEYTFSLLQNKTYEILCYLKVVFVVKKNNIKRKQILNQTNSLMMTHLQEKHNK